MNPPIPPPHCPWCGCHVGRLGGGKVPLHCSRECFEEHRYQRTLLAVRKAPKERAPWLQRRAPLTMRALRRVENEARLPIVTGEAQ